MNTYIALLKGINVGGKKPLKMQDLINSLASLNLQNLKTYIQSGNIIFQTKDTIPHQLEEQIHNKIKSDFNLNIPVLVFTLTDWSSMVDRKIFEDKEDILSTTFLTFWSAQKSFTNLSLLDVKKHEQETYEVSTNCFYLYTPNGYSNTKLNQQYLEKMLNTSTTTRNLKTCLKIYDIAKNL